MPGLAACCGWDSGEVREGFVDFAGGGLHDVGVAGRATLAEMYGRFRGQSNDICAT